MKLGFQLLVFVGKLSIFLKDALTVLQIQKIYLALEHLVINLQSGK